MPLSLEELKDLQCDAMADDVDIDLEKMSLWTVDEARNYFESGGVDEPAAAGTAPAFKFTSGGRATGKTPWLAHIPREKDGPAKRRVVVFSWTGNRGGQGSAHNLRRSPINCNASTLYTRHSTL